MFQKNTYFQFIHNVPVCDRTVLVSLLNWPRIIVNHFLPKLLHLYRPVGFNFKLFPHSSSPRVRRRRELSSTSRLFYNLYRESDVIVVNGHLFIANNHCRSMLHRSVLYRLSIAIVLLRFTLLLSIAPHYFPI